MSVMTHLSLGRVSNLPTVWTNVLCAGAIAGTAGTTADSSLWLPLLAGMSLFYIAGMYYNDACDAEFDSQHQPQRPIASGCISRSRVEAYALVYAMTGFLLVYSTRLQAPAAKGTGSIGWLLSVIALLGCIIVYDRHHKQNPLSPLLMAGCRAGVLLTTAYALTANPPAMLLAALLSTLCWIMGLTYFAKQEQSLKQPVQLHERWPLVLLCAPVITGIALGISTSYAVLLPAFLLVPVIAIAHARITRGSGAEKGSAIALMIAGICLVDGIFMAWVWGINGAIVSILGFGLTLMMQKFVSGT